MKLIRTAAYNGCEEAKEFLDNPDNLPATRNNTPARIINTSYNSKKSNFGDNLLVGTAIGASAALLGAAAWLF